jgi:hypothetical protein
LGAQNCTPSLEFWAWWICPLSDYKGTIPPLQEDPSRNIPLPLTTVLAFHHDLIYLLHHLITSPLRHSHDLTALYITSHIPVSLGITLTQSPNKHITLLALHYVNHSRIPMYQPHYVTTSPLLEYYYHHTSSLSHHQTPTANTSTPHLYTKADLKN